MDISNKPRKKFPIMNFGLKRMICIIGPEKKNASANQTNTLSVAVDKSILLLLTTKRIPKMTGTVYNVFLYNIRSNVIIDTNEISPIILN